jgi:hypothetical protein
MNSAKKSVGLVFPVISLMNLALASRFMDRFFGSSDMKLDVGFACGFYGPKVRFFLSLESTV